MTVWKDKRIVPLTDLEIWANLDDKQASGPVSVITDFSGMGRNLSASGSIPNYSPDVLSGRGGVYLNGSNAPLNTSSGFTLKHAFLLVSYDDATFASARGLLTALASNPILVGMVGTSQFTDFGYGAGFRYRIMDVLLDFSNMLAPANGKVALIEIQYDAGFNLPSLQIGQNQGNTSQRWKGYFFELMAYSSIKDDYDRFLIYQYFALKFHVWQQSVEGLNIFPFPANHSRSKSIGRRFFTSTPYSGPEKNLLRGDRFATLDASFEQRREAEFTAAVDFHAEHYGIQDFVFRDYKYHPPKDAVMKFTSDIKDSGGEDSSRLFNYGFSARGTATPSAPANSYGLSLVDDEDVFIVV